MESYPKYKNSGVNWLGEIPIEWSCFFSKRIFKSRNERAKPDDLQLAATQKFGVIPQNDFMKTTGKKVALAVKGIENFKHIESNDFLISLRSFEGGIEFSSFSGAVSPAYSVLAPYKRIINGYYIYLFKCIPFVFALRSLTDSLRDGKTITYEQFSQIILPLPPLPEQKAIAKFLDRETKKIDHLITKQEELITLLEEKRQALISHAVTKGLNPKAKMKYSGVEWLGDIPEHWEIWKLKHLVKQPLMYGANEAALDEDPTQPRFIRITDISSQDTLREDTFKSLKYEIALPFILKDLDILLARSGATVGKSILYRKSWGLACFAGYLIKVSLNSNLAYQEYIYFYLNSKHYWEFILGSQIQSTIQNVSGEKYSQLPIPLPPLPKQKEISEYLDLQTKKFDFLKQKAQSAIEILKEKRSSLISAAVTGKIDVREEA